MTSAQPIETAGRQALATGGDVIIQHRGVVLLGAWTTLDMALSVYVWQAGSSGATAALLALALAFLSIAAVACRRDRTRLRLFDLLALLVAGTLVATTVMPYRPFGPSGQPSVVAASVAALVGLGGAVASRILRRSDHLVSTMLMVMVGAAIVLRAWLIAADASPDLDVYFIQRAAGEHLASGENPYLGGVYAGGYPYWPLSAVAAAVGIGLGDIRWALVLADALTVAGMYFLARRLAIGGGLGLIAAGLLLWGGMSVYVSWLGFPEPLVVCALVWAAAALAGPAPNRVVAGVLAGIALGVKQVALGVVGALALAGGGLWRSSLPSALVTVAAILLPFVAADASLFMVGSVTSHLDSPARSFELTLAQPIASVFGGARVPLVLVIVVATGWAYAASRKWEEGLLRWMIAAAAGTYLFFLFAKISYVNYYQIVLALLLALVLATSSRPDAAGAEDGQPPAPDGLRAPVGAP